MEVGAEMGIYFHLSQVIGCLLSLRTVKTDETAKVPLKSTTKIFQII
jgi:hypothetical protein